IEPAEVPTNARQSANRTPVASSRPASTPFIQPSPRIPPPPRTSTSGSRKLTAGTIQLYVITYGRMAAIEAIHIGPRVRALREAMDLSLRDLAERSGVSAPMLSQV